DEADIHAADRVDLVEVDLGEDDLFLQAEGVVAAAVEGVAVDAAEVTHAGQRDVEQAIHELVHTLTTQGDLSADGHALAQLEVCNALLGLADNSLLAGDQAQVSDDGVDNLGVLFGFAGGNIDD